MIAKFKRNKSEFQQSLFFSIFLGVLLLAVVGFLVVSNVKINKKRTELNSRIESLQNEIQTLEKKSQQLQAQMSQVLEADYLEKEARERFNLKKPGEEVVVVLPAEEKQEERKEERKWWNPFTW